jgi:hypothetical protein
MPLLLYSFIVLALFVSQKIYIVLIYYWFAVGGRGEKLATKKRHDIKEVIAKL